MPWRPVDDRPFTTGLVDRIAAVGELIGIPFQVADVETLPASDLTLDTEIEGNLFASVFGGLVSLSGAGENRELTLRSRLGIGEDFATQTVTVEVEQPNEITGLGRFDVTLYETANVFGTRRQASLSVPGQCIPVEVSLSPPSGTTVHNAEEKVPAGWGVQNISNGGFHDSNANVVRWGPFFDASPRVLRYEICPPVGEPDARLDAYSFDGRTSADGVSAYIGGVNFVTSATHPADFTPEDTILTIDEITAYGAAWKTGVGWPRAPMPPTLDFVTRAGLIWKNGESYRYNPQVARLPLVWENLPTDFPAPMPVAAPQAAGSPARGVAKGGAKGVGSTAVASLSGAGVLAVSIEVDPISGVQVYAVEDSFPAGWEVSAISAGGAVDETNRKVKWGPFFDGGERTLSYEASPPAGGEASGVFYGFASFDGQSVSITGDRTVGGGGASAFAVATAAAGLGGVDAEPTAVPFHDGTTNLEKFAFNLDLASPGGATMRPGGTSGLPAHSLVEIGGQSYWRVEYLRRIAGGLIYTPTKSQDLAAGGYVEMTGARTVSPVDATWERVVLLEPVDPEATPSSFGRVEVTLP